MYANSKFCYEHPEDEMCRTNYDPDGKTQEEINDIMKDKNKEYQYQNLPLSKKILKTIIQNWYFIVIPFVLISIYYTIRINKIKKKVNNQ